MGKNIVVGDTQFEQRVYFCRHTLYKARNTVDRIVYHVGLNVSVKSSPPSTSKPFMGK